MEINLSDQEERMVEGAMNKCIFKLLEDGSFDLLIELFRGSVIRSGEERYRGKIRAASPRREILLLISLKTAIVDKVKEWARKKIAGLNAFDRDLFVISLQDNTELLELWMAEIRQELSKQIIWTSEDK